MDNLLNVIQKIVKEKGISYIDAVLLYCENTQQEVEYVADIIKENQNFASLLYNEAEKLNLVEKIPHIDYDTI